MPTRDQDADLERISKQGTHWNRLQTDQAYRQTVGEMATFRIEAMLEAICNEMGLEIPPKYKMEDSVVRAARPSDLKDAGDTPVGVAKADPEVPAPQAIEVGGDEELGQGLSLTGEEILGRGYTGGFHTPVDSSDDSVRSHLAEQTAGMGDPEGYEARQGEEEEAEDTSEDPHNPGQERESGNAALELVQAVKEEREAQAGTAVDADPSDDDPEATQLPAEEEAEAEEQPKRRRRKSAEDEESA